MIYAIFSAVIMGFIPILNKFGVTGLSPVYATFLNSFVAFLIAFITINIKKTILVKPDLYSFLVGILNSCGLLFMYFGLEFLNPALASVLGKSYFIFILLIGCLIFKERFNKKMWLLILISLSGVLLITNPLNIKIEGSSSKGFLFVILSSCSFAFSNTMAKKAQLKSTELVLFNNFITMIVMLVVMLITNQSFSANLTNIAYISIAAFFGSYLGLVFYYKAIKTISFTISNLVREISPIITILVTLIILPSKIELIQWIGMFIILVCSILMVKNYNNQK